MAKSKSKKKPEPVEEEEVLEEEEAVAEEEEAAEVEADADADADKGDDEPPDDDEDSIDQPPPKPKPKITALAMILIFLNWLVAPCFLIIAFDHHVRRAEFSHRTVLNYAQVWGLPLQIEEDFPSVSGAARPVQRLNSEQLQKAYQSRGTGVSLSDKFAPVEEGVPFHLKPSDMNEAVMADIFSSLGDPRPTLEAEMERLKSDVPAKIAAASKEIADTLLKKPEVEKRTFVQKNLVAMQIGDAAQIKAMEEKLSNTSGAELDELVKRAIIQRVRYPIVWNTWQDRKAANASDEVLMKSSIDLLDDKVSAAKGAELDKLVDESLQRRLYYEILAPINIFRPGDMADAKKKFRIERIGHEELSLAEIKGFLEQRIAASASDKYDLDTHLGEEFWQKGSPPPGLERDAIEKRRTIAFIMFTLGQVQKPLVGGKLYPKGVERAQVVSGLYEFTNASIDFVRAEGILQTRIADAVANERRGFLVVVDGKEKHTPGFAARYGQEVDRLVKVAEQIDTAQHRLADLKKQRDHFNKLYLERADQYKQTLDRLLKARASTAKYADELRELQTQLHDALRQLSDAGDRNLEIMEEIRALERNYQPPAKKKGGKQ